MTNRRDNPETTSSGHLGRAHLPGASLAALSIPMLMSSLDTSITNAVLPTLARALDAPFEHVQWVVLSYLLAVTTLIVGAGSLGDVLGPRRLMLAGIALFTAASAACGFATTLGALIAARGLQGLGAACMMALSLASVGDAIPGARVGRAIGLLGTMSAIGTALGPSLGGLLASSAGWRAVFLINVPIGVVSFALALLALPPDRRAPRADRSPIDFVGMLLLAVTLAAYSLAMTMGHPDAHLWRIALLLTAALGGGLFVLVESRAAVPLVRVQILRDRALASRLLASGLVASVMMSTLVIGPFYLARALGLDATGVGLVLSVGPLCVALSSIPAGRAVDRFGAGSMARAGLVGIASGTLLLCLLPTSLGVGGYLGSIVILTAGYALFQTANNTLVMSELPLDRRGVVSGLLSLSRNLGLITGASSMGTLFTVAVGTSQLLTASPEAVALGMRTTFAASTAIVAIALALTRRNSAGQREPSSASLEVRHTTPIAESPR